MHDTNTSSFFEILLNESESRVILNTISMSTSTSDFTPGQALEYFFLAVVAQSEDTTTERRRGEHSRESSEAFEVVMNDLRGTLTERDYQWLAGFLANRTAPLFRA